MTANTGKLAGRTVFITGASRGIGKAIALKCARDGANIVIAAKTAQPHPKLPGTIYTAAKEIEEAGGRCLPCVVDIRYEDQVRNAIQQAVAEFGGIDILVNNASAIAIAGTEDITMKRYDLLMDINVRGTFLCSKYALPYLKKGTNPHILNCCPPLNTKNGSATMSQGCYVYNVVGFIFTVYTMSKYGMSMCVLGMAREFEDDGVAVNGLWPATGIYTSAIANFRGPEARVFCRTADIQADAAYTILTKDSRQFTGNFCIDEDLLRDEGVTNFESYKCVPDGTLRPAIFVDNPPDSRL